jgi:hypothetical protein
VTADEINALLVRLRHCAAGEALPLGYTRGTVAAFSDDIRNAASALETLTLENRRLRVDAQNWRDFAEHQTWCQACAESVSLCSTGSDLQAIAMQHSDKEKP